MPDQLTHLDVGITMSMAHVLGVKPTVDILCGSTDGDRIHDDYICIQIYGTVAAACTCPDCKAIAAIMHYHDCSPERARALYHQQRQRRAPAGPDAG